jgi:predicted AlkP superfamily phosphohydrolase/phosphomutase
MKLRHAVREVDVPTWVGVLTFVVVSVMPLQAAHAYVGPGAGFAVISSFLIFFVAFALVGLILATTPLRLLWRLVRRRHPRRRGKYSRVVVIGLDGMSPVVARRLMDQGKLPSFRELQQTGAFCPLRSTLPSVSPVAWSTFQTGVYPDKHNIFDFLTRDRRTYLPVLSSARIEPPKRAIRFGSLRIPLGKPRIKVLRKNQPFWKILGDHGVFCMVLRVPITFPIEKFSGVALAGMCAPDVRGTQGSFTYFTTEGDPPGSRGSGVCVGVTRKGNRVSSAMPGPASPLRPDSPPMAVPFSVTINGNGDSALLEICGQRIPLIRGKHSPWVRVDFSAGLGLKVSSICRFCLLQTSPEFKLYATPLNINPEKPALPLSHPFLYAPYLAKVFGPFATLGLAEDTNALNEQVLDETAFLEQAYLIHDERQRIFFDALDKVDHGMVACVFDITDRVQHMFWQYTPEARAMGSCPEPSEHAEAVEACYQEMDRMLGRAMEQLGRDDLLIVMSDHGFTSFQRCVNLNSWLMKMGLLVLREGAGRCEGYFANVDWSRTKAYALGLGGIFINQTGREAQGIVHDGEEKRMVKQAIIDGLLALRDDASGAQAVRRVFDAAAHYHGPYAENGPDLIVGFAEGYRVSWDAVTGKFDATVIEPNAKAWSGDHCVDPDLVPGVLFCNRRVAVKDPGIVDIAPTVLAAFGVPVPTYMDGKPFLAADDGPSDAAENGKDEDHE